MASFLDTFRRQGGMKLIRDYWHNCTLGTALVLLPVLGKSKTALELLRECVTLKTHQRLSRRYAPLLADFDRRSVQTSDIADDAPNGQGTVSADGPRRKVWVCWLQGMDEAPALVKRCYESIHACIKDREIVLLTADNLAQYTELPDYILTKYHAGIISRTHFSDLLRVEILSRHGGTWIDATVMCLSPDIPSYMLDAELFLFQRLKPGADGSAIRISSWFITAAAGNKIMLAVRHLLWEYWRHENRLCDYFLLHHFIMMASQRYADEWRRMIQFPNSLPHVLLLQFFEPFDAAKWDALRTACPIQKLSYKFDEADMARPGTYYQHVLSGEC